MGTLEAIIAVFIAPFLIFGFIALVITSAYAFITFDSSAYSYVIDFFNPMVHAWVRVLMIFWGCVSLAVGSVFGQLG